MHKIDVAKILKTYPQLKTELFEHEDFALYDEDSFVTVDDVPQEVFENFLMDYIKTTISSNFQYDFDVDINIDDYIG